MALKPSDTMVAECASRAVQQLTSGRTSAFQPATTAHDLDPASNPRLFSTRSKGHHTQHNPNARNIPADTQVQVCPKRFINLHNGKCSTAKASPHCQSLRHLPTQVISSIEDTSAASHGALSSQWHGPTSKVTLNIPSASSTLLSTPVWPLSNPEWCASLACHSSMQASMGMDHIGPAGSGFYCQRSGMHPHMTI